MSPPWSFPSFTQNPCGGSEEFVGSECAWDQTLAQGVRDNLLERSAERRNSEAQGILGAYRNIFRSVTAFFEDAIHFAHDVGLRLRDGFADHRQMIDRHAAVFRRPGTAGRFVIRDQMLHWPLFRHITQDGGVDLTVEQHLLERLSFGSALDDLGLLVFGQMWILKRHPANAVHINAV